jgi:anthranilate synthase component 1
MKAFPLHSFPGMSPLSLFVSLKKQFGSPIMLLESAVQDETNRVSIVACKPIQSVQISENICDTTRNVLNRCHTFPDNPYFSGGLMGSFMFESVFDFYPKYKTKHTENIPRTLLYEFGLIFIFDHAQNLLVVLEHPNTSFKNVESLFEQNILPAQNITVSKSKPPSPCPQFLSAVERGRKAIYEGEIFQIVLSHVFQENFPKGKEIELYTILKQNEPTTHLILADYESHGIYTCASPEIIGKKTGKRLLVSPIAGTRRRKNDQLENQKTEHELLSDSKENTEHDMLVDLGRNDLGRIAIPGSIHVTRHKYLQSYQHVMHLLSDIEGEIDPSYNALDFLQSIFPAGTLSGAPKLRAIKLIQESEPCARGFYGGATGIIETNGNLQMAINIRGVHISRNKASLQVGAGIVKDSIPQHEWKEVLNKSQTLRNILFSLQS